MDINSMSDMVDLLFILNELKNNIMILI
jgi:C1A family cysteine protease